jgi:hypothetical protein
MYVFFLAKAKFWLDLQFHDSDQQKIVKPNEIPIDTKQYPPSIINDDLSNRIQGSMLGLAIGDALGAHVEFRPRSYLEANLVKDLEGGGTWGLKKGQVNTYNYINKRFFILALISRVKTTEPQDFKRFPKTLKSGFSFIFPCVDVYLLWSASMHSFLRVKPKRQISRPDGSSMALIASRMKGALPNLY